jgi:AcrR family transcriptional regulator
MPRLKGADRRRLILEAAERTILRKGLAAATTRDVTSDLGVAAGLLAHYFSWSALRAAAFSHVIGADIERSVTGRVEEAPEMVLADLVDGAFSAEADALWRLWLEAADQGLNDPALADAASQGTDRWQAALSSLLARGRAAGAWACPSPDESSWRIIAILLGLAGLCLIPGSPLSRDAATHHLRIAVSHECETRA